MSQVWLVDATLEKYAAPRSTAINEVRGVQPVSSDSKLRSNAFKRCSCGGLGDSDVETCTLRYLLGSKSRARRQCRPSQCVSPHWKRFQPAAVGPGLRHPLVQE